MGSKSAEASTLKLKGRLYSQKKEWKKAKESFEKSIVIFKELKNKLELGLSYYYYGRSLKEQGKLEAGKQQLIDAKKIFKKLGAKGWLKKVEKQLKESKA